MRARFIVPWVMVRLCFAVLLCVVSTMPAYAETDVASLSRQLFTVQGAAKQSIATRLASTNDRRLIPTLVLAMRWTRNNVYVAEALSKLAGEQLDDWHDAYAWQERHPQIAPHPSFSDIKFWLLGNTDARFLELFQPPNDNRETMQIRLEEIIWGGALFDKIPSLDQPKMISAVEAEYLKSDDLVFGVAINGDVRAYPLRIMGWHEMLNDVIGGVPVTLAYCTLCSAGILFETKVTQQTAPFIFGSTGLLYRSNKLMFDRKTNSVWNQFTGEPVIGPLAKSGLKLKIRPMITTTWAQWNREHPTSKVLSLDTGYFRNYDSGYVYREYFASSELMFPAAAGNESYLKRKDYVYGIRQFGLAKAWPIEAFEARRIIHDQIGGTEIVLIGNAKTRTVRSYQRNPGQKFSIHLDGVLRSSDTSWEITEEYLVSKDGSVRLPRIAGHLSYWFAWDNYLGAKSELFTE